MLHRLSLWIYQRSSFQYLTLVVWLLWAGFLIKDGVIVPTGLHAGIDYLAFYTSGQLTLEGRSKDVYSESAQIEKQHAIPGIDSGIMHFLNPPPFLLLCAPLASLPFQLSLLLWSILSLAMLLLSVHFLTETWNWKYLLCALSFFPVFAAIKNGQSSLLGLFALSSSYALLRNGRDFESGLAACLLIYKPFLALGLAVWLISSPRKFWKVILGGLVGGVCICLLSFWITPGAWPAFKQFSAEALANWIYINDYPVRIQYTARGFLLSLFPHQRILADICGYVVTLLALCLVIWKCRKNISLEGAFAWSTLASIVGAPYLLIHDWTLLLIPGLLWARGMKTISSEKQETLILALFLVWALSWVGRAIVEIQFDFAPIVLHVPYIGLILATLMLARNPPSNGTNV